MPARLFLARDGVRPQRDERETDVKRVHRTGAGGRFVADGIEDEQHACAEGDEAIFKKMIRQTVKQNSGEQMKGDVEEMIRERRIVRAEFEGFEDDQRERAIIRIAVGRGKKLNVRIRINLPDVEGVFPKKVEGESRLIGDEADEGDEDRGSDSFEEVKG